jgi:hypothetical protein
MLMTYSEAPFPMKYLIGLLVFLCILGISMSAHVDKNQQHDTVLHASSTKLTDKVVTNTNTNTNTDTDTNIKQTGSKSAAKLKAALSSPSTNADTPAPSKSTSVPPEVAATTAFDADVGWGAIHLTHRSLSSLTRSQRIKQLRSHHTSLLHDAKLKLHNSDTSKSSKSHTTAKAHATSKSMRRSRHHAARARTMAKLTSKASVTSGSTSEVLLTNLDDIEYLATVTLGTPPQSFSV